MRSLGLTPFLVFASLLLSGCPGGSGSDRCALECMGCCSNGVCQAGSANTACGGAGAACQVCPSGKSCVNNACQVGGGCSTATCPQGCCKGDTCVPLASQSVSSCGTGGAACQTCSAGSCTNGSCTGSTGCSAANCLGCCASDQCFLFAQQSVALCGKSGAACSACSPQGQCTNGTCSGSTCSASTCSNGCCSATGGCLPLVQQSTGACGTNGAVCTACPNAGQCLNGVCQGTTCGPGNCQGCCQGATCLIYGQQTTAQCGKNGAACQSCGGLTCASGVCGDMWKVGVVSCATRAKASGDWDPSGITGLAPDPMVVVTVKASGVSKSTTYVNDEYNPHFNQANVLSDTFQNLTAAAGITAEVKDDDSPFGAETMGSCQTTLTLSDLNSGTKTLTSCSSYVDSVVLSFSK